MTDLIKREDAIKVVESFLGADPIADKIKIIPSIETKQIKYFDEDEKVWKIGSVIVDE